MLGKIIQPYRIWIAGILFVAILFLTAGWYTRIDLTAEKRYTLSPSTQQLLSEVDSTIDVQVFLTGDLPANYKKLSVATAE